MKKLNLILIALLLMPLSRVLSQTCVNTDSASIIAWWSFDDTTSSDVKDFTRNHNGKLVNGTRYSSGNIGNAVSFDGSNDHIEVADNDVWAWGYNNFSIEFWASMLSPGGTLTHPEDIFICTSDGGGETNKWWFAYGDGLLSFHVNHTVPKWYAQTSFSANTGQWYHLAVTRSGDTLRIFINGTLSGSEVVSGLFIYNSKAPLTLATGEGHGFMKGKLDEMTVYNRALSEKELSAIYQAGKAGKCKNRIESNIITGKNTLCPFVTAKLTGSTPNGGVGKYGYKWLSSTVGEGSGYGAAQGNNQDKDYTSKPLTQKTWFKRLVTSGSRIDTSKAYLITILSKPNVTAMASDTLVCKGTKVILTGKGATIFNWSHGVTDSVGFIPDSTCTYSVIGRYLNNCTDTAKIKVSVNPLPKVTILASDSIVCFGTAITLRGDGALTYKWTNGVVDNVGFVPLLTTNYSVTGTDANNCSASSAKTITINPVPKVGIIASDTIVCKGQSARISGTGALLYYWSHGITNASAFIPDTTLTYTVIGINGNDCADSANIKITVNVLPKVFITATDTIICSGTSVVLTGKGAVSYKWSGGIIDGKSFVPFSTQTYVVVGTDGNNCSDTANIAIKVNFLPDVTTSLTGNKISANQTGASYQWLDCSMNYSSIAGATNQTFTAIKNGQFAVVVKLNNCSDTSACVNINTTSIEKSESKNNILMVYPNPSSGAFTMESKEFGDYIITDAIGRVINYVHLDPGTEYKIDNLIKGIYLIRGQNDQGFIRQKVLVIN